MSFCGLTKGISQKVCIILLCVRVITISVLLNLFVFGSSFRTLAVIPFQGEREVTEIQTRKSVLALGAGCTVGGRGE